KLSTGAPATEADHCAAVAEGLRCSPFREARRSCDDLRSSRHRLQQGPGKRPRFLPRCPEIPRGGRRSRLAYFCVAAGGGGVSSFREERPARAVLHVRQPEDDDEIVEREESEM